jgi:hypothetical protein
MPQFAGGTDATPGSWSIVGERAPEITNVPKGAQIFPNGNFPVNDNAPVNVSYAPIYKVTGMDEVIDRLRSQRQRMAQTSHSRRLQLPRERNLGRSFTRLLNAWCDGSEVNASELAHCPDWVTDYSQRDGR